MNHLHHKRNRLQQSNVHVDFELAGPLSCSATA